MSTLKNNENSKQNNCQSSTNKEETLKLLCPSCEHLFLENKKSMEDFICVSSMGQEKLEECAKCANCNQNIDIFDEKAEINLFMSALSNPNVKVVAYTAPSIRTSLGEPFGIPFGTDVTGKMVSALKKLGVDYVFDMNFAADLTTVEEATEFISRLKSGKNLPMLTSCCPAWVSFVERVYPTLTPFLSSCKSPQQMFGSILNTYYSQKLGIPNTQLFIVSIVPCVAKKLERLKPNINSNKGYDVDCTLTTLDLAKIIELQGINFKNLHNQEFDNEFGLSSGAGVIFGNSGGVMEAVMTSYGEKDKEFCKDKINFNLVRGQKGLRETTFNAFGKTIKIACVSGLANAKPLLDDVLAGTSPYSFIEVMACDGGCVGGGGQPMPENRNEAVALRAKGLYNRALACNHKSSFANPAIKRLYKNFLGDFGSPLAHELLHIKRKP